MQEEWRTDTAERYGEDLTSHASQDQTETTHTRGLHAFQTLKIHFWMRVLEFHCLFVEQLVFCERSKNVKLFLSNLFLWSKLNFQLHYASLQCHMIFRNHNNMLICCSINNSDYVFRIIWWIENSKEQHLFETEIFCNIINVFAVTLLKDNFNTTLLNTIIY